MKEPGPTAERIFSELQPRFIFAHVFGKYHVYGHYVGIETIGAGSKSEIVAEAAECAIPTTPEPVGGNPPDIIEEVRAWNCGNAVPDNPGKIDVFDSLAVNVNLESAGQLRDPLYDAPFRSMPLIEERRNYCETRLSVQRDTCGFFLESRSASQESLAVVRQFPSMRTGKCHRK